MSPAVSVLRRARQATVELGHARIGSEQLVTALAECEGAVAEILASHGVAEDALRETVRAAGPESTGKSVPIRRPSTEPRRPGWRRAGVRQRL